MTMKNYLFGILIFCSLTPVFAQEGDQVFVSTSTERDTIYREIPVPMLSVGMTGGIAFISPEDVNNAIEHNNSVYNGSEFPLTRPAQWGLWISYRPKNLPNYLTLRAEMLTASRTYSFATIVTSTNPNVTDATVASTLKHTYSVYPFTIGTGSVLYKTIAKAEIGFIYAIGRITHVTDVPGYTHSESVYEGEGYGFRVNLQQMIPIEKTFSATMDIGYRLIVIDEFRDAKGVMIKNTELNFSGICLSFGLAYGF